MEKNGEEIIKNTEGAGQDKNYIVREPVQMGASERSRQVWLKMQKTAYLHRRIWNSK